MKKQKRRRTPTAAELREIIPPILDTLENVARTCLSKPRPKRWRFLDKKNGAKEERR